ncbi:hypothetical protein [Halosegnis sp.]|uniref:DUF7559 family protein n=1 Tax=Halosegnis sp. TaxID=2864959 RepID=UPI0035D4D2BA
MPKTMEVVCTDDDCEFDMAGLHFTYDMPDDTGVDAFSCPYCGGPVEEIEV